MHEQLMSWFKGKVVVDAGRMQSFVVDGMFEGGGGEPYLLLSRPASKEFTVARMQNFDDENMYRIFADMVTAEAWIKENYDDDITHEAR